jgi:hypothetical protein
MVSYYFPGLGGQKMKILNNIFGYTLIIFLFIGLTYASVEKKSIDKDQAWQIVKEKILAKEQKNKIVYISTDLLESGQVVKSWGHDYEVPGAYQKAWLFFIDDQPGANWEHACRYVFVDAGSGKYTSIKARTPLDSMEKMKKIFPLPYSQKKSKC